MNPTSLTLYTLGGAFGLRSVSPFCLKLELLLADLDLPYTLAVENDPRKAPKSKLPFLETADRTIADSELIVQTLDEVSGGRVFAGLSLKQRANGVALTRLAEEHLYWIMVASRWLDDAWWPNVVDGFFHIAPALVRPLVAGGARRQVRRTYALQGLGLHSLEEQRGFARRDFQALADALGAQPFLLGETPNSYDYAVTGLLAGIFDQQPPTWINAIADEFPSLRDYAERVQTYVGVFARK
ncbi:MAG: glutathione S-transferase family protein [Pseudomonadota bacterium]